jgi:hypothetical protein
MLAINFGFLVGRRMVKQALRETSRQLSPIPMKQSRLPQASRLMDSQTSTPDIRQPLTTPAGSPKTPVQSQSGNANPGGEPVASQPTLVSRASTT